MGLAIKPRLRKKAQRHLVWRIFSIQATHIPMTRTKYNISSQHAYSDRSTEAYLSSPGRSGPIEPPRALHNLLLSDGNNIDRDRIELVHPVSIQILT